VEPLKFIKHTINHRHICCPELTNENEKRQGEL